MGLVFILAASTCDTSQCTGGCATHNEERSTDLVAPGSPWVTDAICSACGHAQITLAWTVPAPVTITGNVTIKAQITCAPGITAQPSSISGPAAGTSLVLDPTNAKNLCGETGAETYTITVTNSASDLLINPRLTMRCPNLSTGPNPVGPSVVR
jgi:hypothetical protein